MVFAVEQVERDPSWLNGLYQLDGNRHQAETDRPAPYALNCHFHPPPQFFSFELN
jgi:hypothetical protein